MITGAYGQVGFCLTQQAQVNGWDVLAIDRDKLDITDPQAVNALVNEYQPDVIINAAAHTAVDKAETEIDASYAINRDGPKYLAVAADLLLAGGFTRQSLKDAYQERLGWTPATASSIFLSVKVPVQ